MAIFCCRVFKGLQPRQTDGSSQCTAELRGSDSVAQLSSSTSVIASTSHTQTFAALTASDPPTSSQISHIAGSSNDSAPSVDTQQNEQPQERPDAEILSKNLELSDCAELSTVEIGQGDGSGVKKSVVAQTVNRESSCVKPVVTADADIQTRSDSAQESATDDAQREFQSGK